MSAGWPGWEQQEAEPQDYRAEMNFQWAAGCSSKGIWGSRPEFYIAFKTQIFYQYTLHKPLTGSTPICECGLMIMSSLNMAGTNGYIPVDPISSVSVLLSEPKAPVSQEILLPSKSSLLSSLPWRAKSAPELICVRDNKGWSGHMPPPESLGSWRIHHYKDVVSGWLKRCSEKVKKV